MAVVGMVGGKWRGSRRGKAERCSVERAAGKGSGIPELGTKNAESTVQRTGVTAVVACVTAASANVMDGTGSVRKP